MYDFLEITIPLKSDYVDVSDNCGYVNFRKLSSLTGYKVASGDVEFDIDGQTKELHNLYCPWATMPSSYTNIAVKVSDACPLSNVVWGYVRIKASPAKVMQGHNVYGSDNLRTCTEFLLKSIEDANPQLFDALDFPNAEFSRIDSTYSIQMPSRDLLRQAIESFSNISHKYLRPSNKSDFQTTVYFSRGTKQNSDVGRAKTLVIYSKEDELNHQLSELRRSAKRDHTGRFQRVINELSTHELQDFTANRLRFEGRGKKRYIKRICNDSAGIWHVIRHAETFESINGYPFCEWLFKDMFRDMLECIEGTELEFYNDIKIKQLLRTYYATTTKTGKVSYATADRIFRFYMSLCDRGYNEIKAHTPKATLSRNLNELKAIGLSKSDLQNLDKGERMPLSQIIKFDFDNQRPASYVEPKSPYANEPNYLANKFGISHRLSHTVGLAQSPTEQVANMLQLDVDSPLLDSLLDFKPVPVCPRESLSLVIWPDGEITLKRHEHDPFRHNLVAQSLALTHKSIPMYL